jgi:hypothetical protein
MALLTEGVYLGIDTIGNVDWVFSFPDILVYFVCSTNVPRPSEGQGVNSILNIVLRRLLVPLWAGRRSEIGVDLFGFFPSFDWSRPLRSLLSRFFIEYRMAGADCGMVIYVVNKVPSSWQNKVGFCSTLSRSA